MCFRRRQGSGASRSWCVRSFALLLGAMLLAGCAVQTVKTQAFSRLDRLETEFKQGVSTKADVLTVLGEPDGSGGAIFPTASYGSDVWYYEASRSSLSGINMNILLVYFRGEVFDGFMWFSNDADLSMR